MIKNNFRFWFNGSEITPHIEEIEPPPVVVNASFNDGVKRSWAVPFQIKYLSKTKNEKTLHQIPQYFRYMQYVKRQKLLRKFGLSRR